VITAFLISSYPKPLPKPQPGVPTNDANLNSHTAYVIINSLWFLSLAFSLACALAATLVQQWSRTYLQGTEERFNPHQRVRMRTYLQRGVQKFHFSELVDAIPMWVDLHTLCQLMISRNALYRLLHIALFLFFCGLLVFLFNIDTQLAHIMLVFSIPALFIYVLLTSLPIFFYDCPYKTPLTFVLSYITYAIATCRPGRRRHGRQWHPEKQTTHLTNIWAQDGSEQGAELDHTALRWTLLALTDPNDLELFVKALQGLLQSDSGTSFPHNGGRAAQALLFGSDMLAKNVVRLLHSAIPSNAVALSVADRRRLDARAATCLSTVSLLARACDGPTPSTYHLWAAWAASYSNPVVRNALALCEHPQPALATLAHSTIFLLAWRALVAYRTFLADICKRAATAADALNALYIQLTSEIHARLLAGVYLVGALRNVLHNLSGDPASGTSGGALLTQQAEQLVGGALNAYMPGANSRASGAGGLGAGGVMDTDMGALAKAAQAEMVKAKTCLAVLFMHAACALPADAAGQEALQALAAPLGWAESCEYDEEPKAVGLLLQVRHAHGEEALTVLDVDQVVALYLSIHDRRQWRMEPSDVNVAEGSNGYMRPRKATWKQATL
jgi:hypothetical protein